ncbi:MAG: hypothetical protein PR2021_4770 [Candidatus Phytoplasma pruni]|nr:MAG: hypothetical protein PR2021_4770 [Candidatus Phytoplasma pruni]
MDSIKIFILFLILIMAIIFLVFKYKELNDKYSLKSKELRDFKKNFLKKIIAFL